MYFQNEDSRTPHSEYYLAKVEIKDYNGKIDGKKFVDQPINNDTKTSEKIRKISTGQEDDYTLVVCKIILTLKKIIKWLSKI